MPVTARFDVVIATDCRLPGGTSASVAEEIAAQARAGYRTGLFHVASPLVADERAFNAKLTGALDRGEAQLVLPDARVATDLLVLRHPVVFANESGVRLPEVDAEHVVLVANHPPVDRAGARRWYRPDAVTAAVTARFGAPRWAPIGPLVREALVGDAPDLDLREDDWTNVLDVDAWAVEHAPPDPARRAVIGRHSRPQWEKWPARSRDLSAAYPPAFDVRVLGGCQVPLGILGEIPEHWTCHGYDEVPVRDFLAGLDVFVYFHHPGWVEAFGRTILEALASGLPVVLPPHFEVLFGAGARYGPPARVEAIVRELVGDPDAYRAQAQAGQRLARERFSHQRHVERVAALVSEPSDAPSPAATEATTTPTDTRARVLFISTNGIGVGHLMRLMSLARRASDDVVPLFLTMSQAVGVVEQAGFATEYVPSRSYIGLAYNDWHALLRRRLEGIVARHRPSAIVFDGTHPYRGMLAVARDHPEIELIWSRRGMWKPDANLRALLTAPSFDLIFEPGDLAADADQGGTSTLREQAIAVPPVVFLDGEEALETRAAREQLGLDPDRPVALVQLGAGNNYDLLDVTRRTVERLLEDPELQVCLTKAVIAEADVGLDADRVHQISVYPLARYMRAFDLAVAASGYNTFHELIGAGVPTVWVPNPEMGTDDQPARARWAQEAGLGWCCREPATDDLYRCLDAVLDPEQRAAAAAHATEAFPVNGAADAIGLVESLLVGELTAPSTALPEQHVASEVATDTSGVADDERVDAVDAGSRRPRRSVAARRGEVAATVRRTRGRARRSAVRAVAHPQVKRALRRPFWVLPEPTRAWLRRRLRRMDVRGFGTGTVRGWAPAAAAPRIEVPPGRLVGPPPPEAERRLPAVAVIVPPRGPADHERLAEWLAHRQLTTVAFAPLVISFDPTFAPYRRFGFVVEYVLPAEVWQRLHPPCSWDTYAGERIGELLTTYRLDRVVHLPDVGSLDAETLLSSLITEDLT